MKRLLAIALFLAAVLAAATPVAAQRFGDDETLHKIQDVEIVGAENEALWLGYKTTTQNFLLPYTISDDGYVLMVRDGSKKYYPMTTQEIADFQAGGFLPDPLPPYEIAMLERIMGYLLWPALVLIGVLYLIQWRNSKKKKAAAAAAANAQVPAPPDQAGDKP